MNAMKTFFGRTECEKCNQSYDSEMASCPSCHTPSRDNAVHGYKDITVIPFFRQIALFLMGWIGFQVIALIVSRIDFRMALINNPTWGETELSEYASSLTHVGPVHFIAYTVLFLALALITWDGWKKNLRSFLAIKNVLTGVVSFVIIFAASMLYSVILSAILNATGGGYEQNGNENAVEAIVVAYPLLSFLIFGIVGPICEELTYRVGLFSFCARFGKIAAYLASVIVFALIHFDFESFGNAEALLIELYNLPSYLIAGIGLSLAYHKGGFSASFIAHAINNMISVALTLGSH